MVVIYVYLKIFLNRWKVTAKNFSLAKERMMNACQNTRRTRQPISSELTIKKGGTFMKMCDGWKIRIGTPKDFSNQEQITKRCLEIANAAKFRTDYKDMYEHLFENEEAELFMLIDKNEEIYGFATCDKIPSENSTYLHGIIIHPEVQGNGF